MRKMFKSALLISAMLLPVSFTSCSKDSIEESLKSVFNDKEVVGTWFLQQKSGYYSLEDGSEKVEWDDRFTILNASKNSEVFQIKSDNYYIIGGFNDSEKFYGAGGYLYTNIGGIIKKLTLTDGIPTSFAQFVDCLSTYTVQEISKSKLVLVLDTTTEYEGVTYRYYEEKTYSTYSGNSDLLESILSSILP